MLAFLSRLVLLAASYVLFVGQFSADELVLALLSGLVAAFWAASLGRTAKIHFRFEPAAISATARAFAGVPLAIVQVAAVFARAILRGTTGKVVSQPFVRGRDRDPPAVTRRAIAFLGVSLAPDKFALRIVRERREIELHTRREIELHTLVRASAKGDARWLT